MEYNTPLGLTSQFSFCGLPLRLDTYAGCALRCTYCFARLRGGNADTNKVRFANPDLIISKFDSSINRPEYTSGITAEFIRRRMPLHFGGMSDPFQPIELKERISLKVLKHLCKIQYPIVISTKSPIVAQEEYLTLLKSNQNVVVQFSFSTTIDHLSNIIEPYSYAPSEILKSITILSEAGINTTVRWQPYIPMISEMPSDFLSAVSSTGVKHIGFEHLKLPMEKNNPLWKKLTSKLSFNIREFYVQNECLSDGREFVLPAKYKILQALHVKGETVKRGMSFGCADNELQYLSDNNCCCSGVDQFEGFENWNKFQIGYAVKKSNYNEITFDLIANEWKPLGSVDKYLNSNSRIKKGLTHNRVENYIIERWQNLSSPFNPTKFYGVEDSGLKDSKGFRIFKWNKEIKNKCHV